MRKSLTLLIFISLIVGFVAYRAGFVGQEVSLPADSTHNNAARNVVDTASAIDSLQLRDNVLPSADSGVKKYSPNAEWVGIQQIDASHNVPDSIQPQMFSSKSGTIIISNDIRRLDSSFLVKKRRVNIKDSTKKK